MIVNSERQPVTIISLDQLAAEARNGSTLIDWRVAFLRAYEAYASLVLAHLSVLENIPRCVGSPSEKRPS